MWGCTPFRVVGQRLQSSVGTSLRCQSSSACRRVQMQCGRAAVGPALWASVEQQLLETLAFEAQRQSPDRFFAVLRRRVKQVAKSAFATAIAACCCRAVVVAAVVAVAGGVSMLVCSW